jgi:hypothetical protein
MASKKFGDPSQARKAFVRLLEAAKRMHGAGPASEGPNKIVARKMRISPARFGDFLKADFWLPVGDKAKEEVSDARLRKIVTGFATSVERALIWLHSEKIDEGSKTLDVGAVMSAYWPSAFRRVLSSALVEQAIREGRDNAQRGTERIESIEVELWIAQWGLTDKPSKNKLEDSFFARYGKAVFRGIEPFGTHISVESKTLSEVLGGLPLRTPGGDWAVAVGTYDLLDRRFSGLDFVTFPAIRFPMVGLLISRVELPDTIKVRDDEVTTADIRFSFPLIAENSRTTDSLLDAEFPLRRFVAPEDASSCAALYSMFLDEESPKTHGVYTLPRGIRRSVASRLMDEARKHDEPIAFLGDGQLAFEVFADLVREDFNVRVLSQNTDRPEFSFLSGIMFRDEAHKFREHLEEAQRQLFRTPWRVIRFIEHFLKGIDDWLDDYTTNRKVPALWLESRAPIILYPLREMTAYLESAYGSGGRSAAAVDAAAIYDHVGKFCQGLKHDKLIRILFQKTGEWQ